jgi:hypothetical protein
MNPSAGVRELERIAGVPFHAAQFAKRLTISPAINSRSIPDHANPPPEPIPDGLAINSRSNSDQSGDQGPGGSSVVVVSSGSGSSTNNKKLPTTSARSRVEFSRPDWIPEKDWNDLLEHRRKKHAANTTRGLDIIVKELRKAMRAGWDVTAAIEEIIAREWRGFKAEWLPKRSGDAEPRPPHHEFSDGPATAEEIRAFNFWRRTHPGGNFEAFKASREVAHG